LPIVPWGIHNHGIEGNAMTTPWKIFACALVVLVMAAIMMGNASHAHRGAAAVAAGETTTEFPKGPTGPLSAPPVDKVPPPSTTTAVAPRSSLASIPVPSSPAPAATSSSGSSSGSSSSTAPSPSATPSGLPHYGVAETPSETEPSGSDSDVSQTQAPVETASQRVGRRLRGH
jgi:hypothetical protein